MRLGDLYSESDAEERQAGRSGNEAQQLAMYIRAGAINPKHVTVLAKLGYAPAQEYTEDTDRWVNFGNFFKHVIDQGVLPLVIPACMWIVKEPLAKPLKPLIQKGMWAEFISSDSDIFIATMQNMYNTWYATNAADFIWGNDFVEKMGGPKKARKLSGRMAPILHCLIKAFNRGPEALDNFHMFNEIEIVSPGSFEQFCRWAVNYILDDIH